MTRYVCGHPAHDEEVDLTSLVVLERGLSQEAVFVLPLSAIKEAVATVPADAQGAERQRLLTRALTGQDQLQSEDLIVVVPEQYDTGELYGLYEWPEVERSYPELEQLRSFRQVTLPRVIRLPHDQVAFINVPSEAGDPLDRIEILSPTWSTFPPAPGSRRLLLALPAKDMRQAVGLYKADQFLATIADTATHDIGHALEGLQQVEPPSRFRDDAALPWFYPWNKITFRLVMRAVGAILVLVGILTLLDVVPFTISEAYGPGAIALLTGVVLFWISFERVGRWLSQLLGYDAELHTGRWRVLVTCPLPAGNDTTQHRNIFAGGPDERLEVMRGVLATGRDTVLEEAAAEDLAPGKSLERLDAQVTRVLAGQAVFTAILGGVGWLTGGLELLVREQPIAFSLAVAVLALSFAIAASAHVAGAGTRAEGNLNDIEDVRRIYNHRISSMRARVQLATWLYALSLVLAIAVPIMTANQRVLRSTPPELTWSTDKLPPTLAITTSLDSVPSKYEVMLLVRGYAAPDDKDPAVLLAQRAGVDENGKASFKSSVTVPVGRYETVTAVAGVADRIGELPNCGPGQPTPPACSVTPVPIALQPAAPAFDLALKDNRLEGSILLNGVATDASTVTSVRGLTTQDLKGGSDRPGKLLYQSQDGPDPTGKITVKVSIPLPSQEYEYILVGIRRPGEAYGCRHGRPVSGCYEVAVSLPRSL
jgi:hypothetical protein